MSDSRILVGAIAGSFGVKGEVRLKSFCSNPADIQIYSPLQAENKKTYTLKIINPIKNGFIARLSGINSKGEADSLRGLKLYVERSRLPALPDDEYYYSDLIG
ncbi:MAG: ribosome maturation factor RimM, partial [Proteobacteria bacterium]|nr:ribosome maturation factor RimM [Pseudomonadota bacterium]